MRKARRRRVDPHLFITPKDLPQIMNIKLWLHILATIVCDERDLERMLLHEVEGFLDLWHCGLLRLAAMHPPGGSRPVLVGRHQWLHVKEVGTAYMTCHHFGIEVFSSETHTHFQS